MGENSFSNNLVPAISPSTFTGTQGNIPYLLVSDKYTPRHPNCRGVYLLRMSIIWVGKLEKMGCFQMHAEPEHYQRLPNQKSI